MRQLKWHHQGKWEVPRNTEWLTELAGASHYIFFLLQIQATYLLVVYLRYSPF